MSARISAEDFVRAFAMENVGLPELALDRLEKTDLAYRLSTKDELAEYVLEFLKLMERKVAPRSREENLAAFERGWTENLDALRLAKDDAMEDALRPRYFRGSRFFRYNNELVLPDDPMIEHHAFVIARLCLFHKYLRQSSSVCELGCGSCANLLLLSKILPNVEMIALDWTRASTAIAAELSNRIPAKISGHVFDLSAPDFSLKLPEGAALFTIHAFEQLGAEFGPALDFMLQAKPSIVVQYEPITEFFRDDILLDYLPIRYVERRHYLCGLLRRLREFEARGKLKILDAFRPFIGGVLFESSVIVWQPVADM